MSPKDMGNDNRDCPECGTRLPVQTGYITWCHACEWNLLPQSTPEASNRWQRMSTSAKRSWTRQLFDRMKDDPKLRPSTTFTKIMAYVAATMVHMITLGFALLGFWLLWQNWPNIFAIVGGLLFLTIAWVLFPRMEKMPENIVARERIPILYQLADNISQELGIRSIAGIIIGTGYSAALIEVGWQRKKVLYIGLPLFAVLNGQERVAVIAHELAHAANRDPLRGLYIGSALASLDGWIDILGVGEVGRTRGLTEVGLIILLLSLPSILTRYLLTFLLARESQRAEYLADYLASQIGGKEALLSTLRKLHFDANLRSHIVAISASQNYEADLFDRLRLSISEVPERELDRVWRIAELEVTNFYSSHPPVAYRVALLDARGSNDPRYTISESNAQSLEAELGPFEQVIQKKLVDAYRLSIG